jgi:hypothetical protein
MNESPATPRYTVLSSQDFAALGLERIAYVKPIARDGAQLFEVHTADGTAVAVMDSMAVAIGAVIEHGLVPLQVH